MQIFTKNKRSYVGGHVARMIKDKSPQFHPMNENIDNKISITKILIVKILNKIKDCFRIVIFIHFSYFYTFFTYFFNEISSTRQNLLDAKN